MLLYQTQVQISKVKISTRLDNFTFQSLHYSYVSNKRTIFNNRTGPGDKISKKNKLTGPKSSAKFREFSRVLKLKN